MSDIIVEDIPGQPQKPQDQSDVATARGEPISHLALMKRFNIDTPTKEEENKLAEIWTFAQSKANSENIQDIIWEVIHLEGVIGSPKLGESRLDKLYRYAKLRRHQTQIEKELRDVAGV